MNTNLNLKTMLFRWFPVVLSMVIIFLFSGDHDPYRLLPAEWFRPTQTGGISKEDLGHFGHILEFALLGFTALRAIVWQQDLSSKLILVSAALSVVYAISDEFHQLFVPGRAFQVQDLLFDGLGILVGFILQAYFLGRRRNKIQAS